MLKKICKCGKLINQSQCRCTDCMKKHKAEKRESNKVYNSSNRDKDIDDFYHSSEWEDIREYILSKYKYLDLYDYFINSKTTTANTVHHIIEIKENYELRLEEGNLIPLSPKSHSKVHKLYRRDKQKAQDLLRNLLKLAIREGIV